MSEDWVLRQRQQFLFALSAHTTVVLFVVGLAANILLPPGKTIPNLRTAAPVEVVGAIVGAVCALAALLLWLGMCWCWLRFDMSSRRRKILWFLALLLTNWVGATAYYFMVYRREVAPREKRTAMRSIGSLAILINCCFFAAIPLLYFYPRVAASSIVSLTLLLAGFLIVIPTVIFLVIRLCRQGLRGPG